MAYDESEPGTAIAPRAQGTRTAEIIPFDPTPIALRDSTFEKIATKPVTKAAAKILTAEAKPNEVDILPTGEVYVPQVHYRRRLNRAFGPMGWALRPLALEAPDERINQMYQRFALVALGRVVATAVGSAKYFPTNRDGKQNARMDYADTAESVKSNALTRCCKDLCVVSECWDRRWCDDWRDKHAVHVYVAEKKNKKNDQTGKWSEVMETVDRWRRIDAKPFLREIEPVKDSPNQDKWRKQVKGWIAVIESEHAASRAVADELRAAKKKAGETVQEAAQAVAETRHDSRQGEPTPDEVESSRRAQEPARGAVQHGSTPKADERPYLIKDCTIVSRQPGKILHKITMMDGQAWFTFSTSIYGKMQLHYARRDQIQITNYESSKSKDQTYRHVTEWRILKQGSQIADREPGAEG